MNKKLKVTVLHKYQNCYKSTLSLKQYKSYQIVFFASCFFLLLIVGFSNIIVDPYGFFNSPKISFLNKNKPELEKNLMLAKATEAKFINAKTIILGSSRVMSGLDISHPILGDKEVVYNLGLPGTNLYQVLKYFKYTLTYQNHVEKVILGLDFFMFNDNLQNLDTFNEARLNGDFSIEDLMDNSLSISTLKASISTILANIKHQKSSISQESTTKKFRRWLTNFLSFEGFYKTYDLSEDRLENFQAIIDLCQKNNLDLEVFISPIHATQYEAITISGIWSTFEQWKREIVKITPVWDFATYNSITTEAISDNMISYIDSSHYSQHTGNLILNRILSYKLETVPQDFGVLVTPENIESHLEEISENRELWQKEHPEESQLVYQLKKISEK